MPDNRKAVIHWVKDDGYDVLPVQKIPAETRFEGALGLVPFLDGVPYLAKIIKISANVRELEKAEEELADAIKKRKEAVPPKRTSIKTRTTGQVATQKDVSKALGERPKLTTPQKEAKKKANMAMKAKSAAQKVVEEKEDEKLMTSAVRSLFGGKGSTSQNRPVLSDEEVVSSGDEEGCEEDSEVQREDDIQEEDATNAQDTGTDDSESDNDTDPQLHEFRNPNTEAFLQFLLQRFRSRGASCPSASPSDKVFAAPLQVPGQKMVHLKKGFALRINKGARNVLVLDKKSQKSATNFVRKTLVQLYGSEQLMSMTVMGRKKDSVSISREDLNAIYEFVCEYTSGLTWGEFTRVVMKKCAASKSSPKQVKTMKTSKAGKKKEESNSLQVIASPSKFKESVVVRQTVEASPIKKTPPMASPMNVVPTPATEACDLTSPVKQSPITVPSPVKQTPVIPSPSQYAGAENRTKESNNSGHPGYNQAWGQPSQPWSQPWQQWHNQWPGAWNQHQHTQQDQVAAQWSSGQQGGQGQWEQTGASWPTWQVSTMNQAAPTYAALN